MKLILSTQTVILIAALGVMLSLAVQEFDLSIGIRRRRSVPRGLPDPTQRDAASAALRYMDLTPGAAVRDIPVDTRHRQLHQRPHRGPARRGRRAPGPFGGFQCLHARGARSASTSNRNFEGRRGLGARTHLVSPPVAAATAVTGHLTAPGDLT
ncbi:hypothetical protein Acsp02_50230 [Actinoplanes sp. NBRC 103695]|nr:hypothetical protein Acsp02_50230 [Actinoplanes sp. NBRC 103695]